MRTGAGRVEGGTPLQVTGATVLDRPALARQLDAAARSGLAVVTAGPGWGKRTTVAAWAAGRAACWVTPEPADSAPRLAARILRSARRLVHELPPELIVADQLAGRATPPARVDAMAAALARMLGAHELVLILDGLHLLPPAGDAARLVAGLAAPRPAGPTLVVVTESTPDGPAADSPLATAPRIGAAQLAFSSAEVAAFLRSRSGTADPAVVAQVHELTSGWPAAVRLAAETVRADGRDAVVRLDRPGQQVLTALAEHVLATVSPASRWLLTAAAVLGRCDAPLGAALGHPQPGAALDLLAEQGLLRRERPDDAGRPAWSPVGPVRDLLRGGPAADPRSVRTIRLLAAGHHADRGEHAAALRQLVAAGDRAAIGELLLTHGETLLTQGEADAVIEAADSLELAGAPTRLLGVVSHARQLTGDWMGALALLGAAAAEPGPLDPGLALRLGQLHYVSGRPGDAVAAYRRVGAVEGTTAEEIRLLCHAPIWLRAVGEDEQARVTAARAAAAADRSGDARNAARGHWVLAQIAAHDGNRPLHDAHHRRGLRLADRSGDRLLQLGLRINRASYLAEEGTPAEALEEAEAALRAGEALGIVGYEPFWYSIRARAQARLGRFDAALADLDTSEQRWQHIGPSFDVAFGLIVRGDVHRRRGEPGQADAILTEALRAADSASMRPLQALALGLLARVRAADDLGSARELADRAVEVVTGTGVVQALLARGWVALLAGAADQATQDATQARATAGVRRDRAGLAEALELAVLTAADPRAATGLLDEADTLWADVGDEVGRARVALVRARLAGPAGATAADTATAALRGLGVRVDSGVADALAVGPWQPAVAVRTLGDFQVHRRGSPVPSKDWRSKKARDLFKLLVSARGRPVSRERLIDLFWPDDPPALTANRLSVLLSTLRSALDPDRTLPEPGPILAGRDTVAVDLDVIVVDAEVFLGLAAAALAADRDGDPAAPDRLQAADAAWTGDYLPDDVYEDWADSQRNWLRTNHVDVLRALLRHSTDPDERQRHLLRLLDHDPYDEHAHRQLVATLRRAGRHGEAERRYRAYAARMAEIGVTPADRHEPPEEDGPRRSRS